MARRKSCSHVGAMWTFPWVWFVHWSFLPVAMALLSWSSWFLFSILFVLPPLLSSHFQIGSIKGFYTLFLYARGRISFQCHDGSPDFLIMVSFPSSSFAFVVLSVFTLPHSLSLSVSLCVAVSSLSAGVFPLTNLRRHAHEASSTRAGSIPMPHAVVMSGLHLQPWLCSFRC